MSYSYLLKQQAVWRCANCGVVHITRASMTSPPTCVKCDDPVPRAQPLMGEEWELLHRGAVAHVTGKP